jgi:hypothetical protein
MFARFNLILVFNEVLTGNSHFKKFGLSLKVTALLYIGRVLWNLLYYRYFIYNDAKTF